MNGRRRPHFRVLRSLNIPASGCTSIATVSPTTRTSARTLFFSSGAANSATRYGSNTGVMMPEEMLMPSQ